MIGSFNRYNRLRIGVGDDIANISLQIRKDLQGLARCDLVGIVISQVSICLCNRHSDGVYFYVAQLAKILCLRLHQPYQLRRLPSPS